MDSPITNTLANVAGRGVGVLAALDSIKSGGLGSYLIQREKAIADPDIRANLIGSPFAAGMLQVSGDTAPARVATPDDFVGPPSPAPAVAGPSDIAYLAPSAPDRRWTPNLPPLSTAEQVKQATEQGTLSGLRGADVLARVQAKLASKIPLTNDEFNAALTVAKGIQGGAGPGSTVGLQIPGMAVQIGSPYNIAPLSEEEFASPDQAHAAAAAHGPGWTIGPTVHGAWKPIPPPTREQLLPATPPTPLISGQSGGGATTPGSNMSMTRPTLPERTNNPGNIKDSSFAQNQPGYVGAGPAATDGGRFAVFDSPASGTTAMSNLLRGPGYSGLTVDQGLTRWSNGGYGGEVGAAVGIDPSRRIGDLNDAERGVLATGMARREGFRGSLGATAATPPAAPATPAEPVVTAPVQTAAVAPPPPPPPPPPTPRRPVPVVVASATPAPPFDPSATVPHVVVPAPAPAEARVGYPPPAPALPAGTMVSTPIPVLRSPTAPPAGAPAPSAVATIPGAPPPAAVLPGIPVDPGNTGLPLTGRTYESQSGSTTYTAPPRGDVHTQMILRYNGVTDPATADPAKIINTFATEQALKNQDAMDKAAIERTQRGFTEGESKDFQRLTLMQHTLDEFLKTYPEAKDRAQFLGVAWAPWQTMLQRIGWQGTRAITDFRNGFAPFSLESLTDEKGKPQPGMEDIARVAPSQNDSPDQFESNLQHFSDGLADKITIAANLRGMPIGAATPALVNSWRDQLHTDRLNARLAAFQPPPAPPPSAAPPPADATAPPPAAPPAPAAPWAPAWIH
jgi:hypothetical protein